jgi:hypothetical protein
MTGHPPGSARLDTAHQIRPAVAEHFEGKRAGRGSRQGQPLAADAADDRVREYANGGDEVVSNSRRAGHAGPSGSGSRRRVRMLFR